MVTRELEIINKLGLHARAAAKFVATASQFGCEIKVERNHRRINGKSIMGLMMLAAAKGSTIIVSAEGDDAEGAVAALETLVLNRFEEDE